VFDPIAMPTGVTSMIVAGINDAGVIVGSFVGDDGIEQGFIGSPAAIPEPGTLALVLPFLLAFVGARSRSRYAR
jgi:hypothetical protein